MEKRKFQTKTLIAEYHYLTELEDFRFSEIAYRLKDCSIIMEYDGACHSLYGLKLSFNKNIAKKGQAGKPVQDGTACIIPFYLLLKM
jgi:hypothetical protein